MYLLDEWDSLWMLESLVEAKVDGDLGRGGAEVGAAHCLVPGGRLCRKEFEWAPAHDVSDSEDLRDGIGLDCSSSSQSLT
ncbi:hypothetical protein EW146_g10112 [Bondarzewia mesenterica]|uniref:Uncharacterized protein n=1 Tax=Bondarzewia mesenterica TaxID=1095465 RepID=A0A4S4L0E4_9AGAM|nr:hypothetical protein EW146_g10112 [Bondarzewia mesenterica]